MKALPLTLANDSDRYATVVRHVLIGLYCLPKEQQPPESFIRQCWAACLSIQECADKWIDSLVR